MHQTALYAYVVFVVGFFCLVGSLLYVQHSERMACIQAGIKTADCAVPK